MISQQTNGWVRRARTSWPVLAVVAVIAAVALVWSTFGGEDDEEDAAVVEGVPAAEAFEDGGFADRLVGRTIAVRGEVSELFGTSLSLAGDEPGTDGLLVVGTGGVDVGEGDTVEVVGVVRHLDEDTSQTELDGDWVDGVHDRWLGENVLMSMEGGVTRVG